MEQCRQRKSAKRIRKFGKRIGYEDSARGSRPRTHRLSADCSSCSRGESGMKQSTYNWYGQGESDCLIKTKNCHGPRGC
ncbi:hypothetical protein ZWY2020_025839 [Hordeum vulgare]|nr:hypothetical protein ZWY2020_025839 [Hordeum vulgare]